MDIFDSIFENWKGNTKNAIVKIKEWDINVLHFCTLDDPSVFPILFSTTIVSFIWSELCFQQQDSINLIPVPDEHPNVMINVSVAHVNIVISAFTSWMCSRYKMGNDPPASYMHLTLWLWENGRNFLHCNFNFIPNIYFVSRGHSEHQLLLKATC